MIMANKVIEKHSSVVNMGKPKLPTPAQLVYGQLAVNFADGYETISLKNSSDEIAVFKTKEQNDKIFINDAENLFVSFEDESDYISASKTYPAISWVDETQNLKYELTENQIEPRCNIKFKGGLDFPGHNIIKNIPDATIISALFANAKPFETLQIEGLEHKDMNIPQLFKDLGNAIPYITAILESGKEYKGYYKLFNKTQEISTSDLSPINYSMYWLGFAPITYIEIDETFQKQFWIIEEQAYMGPPLVYCPLQEIKFISPFILTGKQAMETVYYMVSGFMFNMTSAVTQDLLIKIPAQYQNTFGSPDDILYIEGNDYSSVTFWGVINAANRELETSGSQYRIRVETWK